MPGCKAGDDAIVIRSAMRPTGPQAGMIVKVLDVAPHPPGYLRSAVGPACLCRFAQLVRGCRERGDWGMYTEIWVPDKVLQPIRPPAIMRGEEIHKELEKLV